MKKKSRKAYLFSYVMAWGLCWLLALPAVAGAETLDGSFGSGTATTNVAGFETVASATVTIPAGGCDVMAVASFSTVPATANDAEGIYQITYGGNSSGVIHRNMTSGNHGIGSVVWIFPAVAAGLTTFNFEHSRSGAIDIETVGSLVVIPLRTSGANSLLSSAARFAGPISTLINTYADVGSISLNTVYNATTNPSGIINPHGAFYVAASIQTNRSTGGGSAIGNWKLEYSPNDGVNWFDLGYVVERSITGNDELINNGIVNMVAHLPQQSPTNVYQFRLRHLNADASGTINTLNTNLIAVFTGFDGGFFPTFAAHQSAVSTTSSVLVEAVGFDFEPRITDNKLFLHGQYWMRSTGNDIPIYDLYVDYPPFALINFAFDGPDQRRSVGQGAGTRGSGGSVGLAQGLSTDNIYRARLRHARGTTGQTLTTYDPYLILIDLNSFATGPACPYEPPQSPGRSPGPDNCLFYDGLNNYVTVPHHASLDLTSPFTIEAWIYPDVLTQDQWIIGKEGSGVSPVSIQVDSSGNVVAWWGGSARLTSSSVLPSTCKWYHIAVTYDGTTLRLYINGIQDNTATPGVNPLTNTDPLTIGQRGDGANYFEGAIDEVRIWQAALDVDTIRGWMCKKIPYGDHPNWNDTTKNLSAYWRFDEDGLGTTVYDQISIVTGSSNNDGTATNMDLFEDRICSSAPIGDASVYDYDGTNPGDISVTLTYPLEGDFMTVTNETDLSGSGLHLYYVDDAPNNTVPPFEWGPDYTLDPNRYWGVFVDNVFSINPTYKVEYDWGLHQGISEDYFSTLKLAWREGNCDNPWKHLAGQLLDIGPNTRTLTKTGESGTEYILGGAIQNSGDPLAIVLASFTAGVSEGCVEIAWETATEIDTIGFYLWRSTERNGDYMLIPGSYTLSRAKMETMGARYAYTDCGVDFTQSSRYYYKLEEVEGGQTESRHFYGPIGPVMETASSSHARDLPQTQSGSGKFGCFIDAMME